MADGENYVQSEQHISFYNITGLIERDKNIYYAPQVKDLLNQAKVTVCESYKSLFDVVCPPPSSDFTDMKISQWNPEDRKLKVRGSVDVFRKGSGAGILLNYIVLKIDKGDNDIFYYGFFITNAFQSGVNTVELTLLPDFFTNTFYWGNKNELTEGFDPFNSLITNAFVERQHYDRVKVIESYEITEDTSHILLYKADEYYYLSKDLIAELENDGFEGSLKIVTERTGRVPLNRMSVTLRTDEWEIPVGYEEHSLCEVLLDFENKLIKLYYVQNRIRRVLLNISFNDYYNNYESFIVFKILNMSYFSEVTEEGQTERMTGVIRKPVSVSSISHLDNMDIFVKTEESYNYRQLFKDSRVPVQFNTRATRFGDDNIINKIPAEAYTKKTATEARSYLQYLCSDGVNRGDEADAIVQTCIHYLHIITNEQITYPTIVKAPTPTGNTNPFMYYLAYYNKDFEVKDIFPSASQHIVIPFIAKVKGLEAFADYLNGAWIPAGESIDEYKHGIAINGYCASSLVDGLNGDSSLTWYDNDALSQYISNINDKYGYYIQSMFVTPYCELPCSYDEEQDCVVFNGQLLNPNVPPTTPVMKRHRKGSWWTGYTYSRTYSPTKVVDDYDNAVISAPTIVMLPLDKVETEVQSNVLQFKQVPKVMFEIYAGNYLNGRTRFFAETGETETNYEKYVMGFGFLVGTKGFEHYDPVEDSTGRQVLELKYDYTVSNFKEGYYEPVLEMEPYSFYSLSISEIESPLDRKRYYQMRGSANVVGRTHYYSKYSIPLYVNQSVNTMVKMGVIPVYTINNIEQRYYNDELMFVTTSGVTVKVDSYNAFMYVMSPQLKAQSHLAVYNAQKDMDKALINGLASTIAGAMNQSGAGAVQGVAGILTQQITNEQNIYNVATNIKAQKASAGNKADTFLNAGSDYIYELNLDEYCVMLNHYKIDTLSYNSIAKMLERVGYYVRLYDNLNCYNRKGYNYIKLAGFDFNESEINVSDEQMGAIDTIFKSGVTLLHEKDYLHTNLHNYEVVLDLVE